MSYPYEKDANIGSGDEGQPLPAQSTYGQVGQPIPMGQLPTEAYASWLLRVGATLLDSIPMVAISLIQAWISIAFPSSQVGAIFTGLTWVVLLGYWFWNLIYLQGTTGSTLGKKFIGIKVVDEDTAQPIGVGMTFVRTLAHIIDGMICYIGYLFPLWDKKRQTIADKIIGTVVVPFDKNM